MGVSSSQRPGRTSLGGTGSPAQAVVGAQRGHAGGSSSQQPGHTSLGGQGLPPSRWSVLKGGLRRAVVRKGPGTPASGDRESCPVIARCPRGACGA